MKKILPDPGNILVLFVWFALFIGTMQNAFSQGFTSITPLEPLSINVGTADKTQSKVFNHDGKHWAVLANEDGTHLFRLDGTAWTHILELATQGGRADVKIQGNIAHVFIFRGSTSFLVSLQYEASTQTFALWTPRPSMVGFSFNNEVETATIDIDGSNRMWLAYVRNSQVMVQWSASPYSTWSDPILLADVRSDDKASVIALPGKIGVFWSNQISQRFGFKSHLDTDLPDVWSNDEVPSSQSAQNIGQGMADDHFNMAVSSSGILYTAVKHGYNDPNFPLISLLIRNTDGTWQNSYEVSRNGTTPIVVLNETLDRLKVVYSSQSFDAEIVYKESSTSTISFGAQQTLIGGANLYRDPTSIKSNYHPEVVILATNQTGGVAVGVLASDAVIPSVPIAPSLVSPDNSATGQPLNPTLSWNSVTDADNYQVQVSLASDFATTVTDEDEIANTSFQLSGLQYETQYYWRVRAVNEAGTGDWSSARNFTTEDEPLAIPGAPSLVSPANSATGQPLNPTLSWGGVTDAETYQLQVSVASDFATAVTDEDEIANTSFQLSGLQYETQYYWRVRAVNEAGEGAWSSVRNFTTEDEPLAVPGAPSLVSPANSATGQPLNPTLSWGGVTDAETYQVQVSLASDFATTVIDEDEIANTSFQLSGLQYETQYYWRVRAVNEAGTGDWSSARNFTTEDEPLAVPGAPSLVSPANSATGQPLNSTLSWGGVTDAETYQLQVSVASDFATAVTDEDEIANTSFQLSGLQYETQYYWRVRAVNEAGEGAWSSVRNFTTEDEPLAVPGAPSLVSPANSATGQPLNPTLSWGGVTDAETYQLQVSVASDFATAVTDEDEIANTSFQLSGLQYETQYYWRVRAVNDAGEGAWSSVRNFTTEDEPLAVPGAPSLVAPDNSATGQPLNPTLSWGGVTDAETYQVQVSLASDFATTVTDEDEIATTSYQLSGLQYETQYYWRVRAVNEAGEGAWSSVRNFTTEDEPLAVPGAPSLVAPDNSATGQPLNPTLSWNSVTDAETYQVQVSLASDFATTVTDEDEIATTSYQLSGLQYETQYYWRVRAVNEAGTGDWSSVWSFTTLQESSKEAGKSGKIPPGLVDNPGLEKAKELAEKKSGGAAFGNKGNSKKGQKASGNSNARKSSNNLDEVGAEETTMEIGQGTTLVKEGLNVRLFPNPVGDYFHLEFDGEKPTRASILIYDEFGLVHFSQEVELGSSRITIYLMDIKLIPGAYYVLIQGQGMYKSIKILKK